MKAELLINSACILGEGPFWHDHKIHWIDIKEKTLFTYKPSSSGSRSIKLHDYAGAVVPRQSGGWTAALRDGFYHIHANGEAEFIADPESHLSDNRFNDGKTDQHGRFVAGTMSLSNEEKKGALYRLERDGSVHKMLDHVSLSNGLAWTHDGNTFYHIDTPTQKINAYDYNLDTGELSNGRTVIEVPPGEGAPDGMTIDTEGNLWVAHWGGGQVACWDPRTGKKLRSIELPVEQVTCCTFGGEEMNELFITTARDGLSQEDLEKQPLAGGLFHVKLDVKGYPVTPFRG
ncbi:SMP-30/gluconolactonase/LRE family protein [Peribacillus kribbensis]|uniref:SMP-30/gluconolactonase/LRE family protein n=1 Tax=Peribacillus kribbensis TaxID=356658 RepID=UPI0004177A99|nr:SMP-30/gluconolactonase/LRE family protein [Peribacillus kribbensis]